MIINSEKFRQEICVFTHESNIPHTAGFIPKEVVESCGFCNGDEFIYVLQEVPLEKDDINLIISNIKFENFILKKYHRIKDLIDFLKLNCCTSKYILSYVNLRRLDFNKTKMIKSTVSDFFPLIKGKIYYKEI